MSEKRVSPAAPVCVSPAYGPNSAALSAWFVNDVLKNPAPLPAQYDLERMIEPGWLQDSFEHGGESEGHGGPLHRILHPIGHFFKKIGHVFKHIGHRIGRIFHRHKHEENEGLDFYG